METDLEILAATIRAHARELAGQEWEREHRPILMQILENAGLASATSTGSRAQGTLSLGDREVPTEAIVKALQERFIAKRTDSLIQKLTDSVVKSAVKRVIEDEETEP
jgi:hypothetical protein